MKICVGYRSTNIGPLVHLAAGFSTEDEMRKNHLP